MVSFKPIQSLFSRIIENEGDRARQDTVTPLFSLSLTLNTNIQNIIGLLLYKIVPKTPA